MNERRIREVRDLQEYLDTWKRGVEDHYWVREEYLADFSIEEEVKEITECFGNEGRCFLGFESEEDGLMGVVDFRFGIDRAAIRRWTPAVPKDLRGNKIEEALLEVAFQYLKPKGVKRVEHRMKHRFGRPEQVQFFLDLYTRAGFQRRDPDAVGLIAKLGPEYKNPMDPPPFEVKSAGSFTAEDFGEFAIRSFASTPEDIMIHGYDKSVSDRDGAIRSFRHIKNGTLGPSPDDLWKIAIVDGEPAGYVGGVLMTVGRHQFGLLGPVGVFPEFRRRGIASWLVSAQLRSFASYNCKHSYVGTPATNAGAIALYESVGYTLADKQILLVKTLG